MTVAGATTITFRNARVVDGSGGPAYTADVRVADGRIERIDNGLDGGIDLDGAVLAPGFIDMHSHSDLRLLEKPGAAEKLTQGVTTEVLGQDGVSVAPIPPSLYEEWAARIKSIDGEIADPWPWTSVGEYLDTLDEADPAVNCAYYAPHGNLRSLLTGFEDRPLTTENVVSAAPSNTLQLEREPAGVSDPAPGALGDIQRELATALDDGAFGMSKGMIYPPSSYARDDELVALAEVLGARDSFMVSHVWNETDRVVESIERYLDICHEGGCHAHVSHLKVGGKDNWGDSTAVLSLFDDAEARGQRVSFDQYPYTAGSTMLTALLPPWARQGEAEDILARLRDEDARERIARDIEQPGDWENLAYAAGSWDNILLTRTASGRYQSMTVADVAVETDRDPVEVVCDVLVAEELDVTMADFVMAEEDIERFLADERGTFCTDGIFGGKPHPRAIGTFGRILERYVRDRETLPLERMVYKAAGRPADVLGLPDRGYVREGYVADLVVFDPEAVVERATYDDPLQPTEGFQYVLVGGTVAVEDGAVTDQRNGTVLRSGREWDGASRPTLDRRAESGQ